MRILVVEDERKLAEVIERGLEEHGYAVDVAHAGDAALGLALVEPYDLILLDVMLPARDGYSICRGLRAGQGRGDPGVDGPRRDRLDRAEGGAVYATAAAVMKGGDPRPGRRIHSGAMRTVSPLAPFSSWHGPC